MGSVLTSGCDCTVIKCTVSGNILRNISDRIVTSIRPIKIQIDPSFITKGILKSEKTISQA